MYAIRSYYERSDILPYVNITSPANNADVTGIVTIRANATDDVEVAGVQFHVDGSPLGAEDVTAPYEIDWDTDTYDPGTYILTAVVRDTDHRITSYNVCYTKLLRCTAIRGAIPSDCEYDCPV